MQKIQVFLRKDQKEALKALAARTGTGQSDLVRQGVDLLLRTKSEQDVDWRRATHDIAGLWRDRKNFAGEQLRRQIKKRFSDTYGPE